VGLGTVGIAVYAEMCGRVAAVTGRPAFDTIRMRMGFGLSFPAPVPRPPGAALDPHAPQSGVRIVAIEIERRLAPKTSEKYSVNP
jgi:hypothetical protein